MTPDTETIRRTRPVNIGHEARALARKRLRIWGVCAVGDIQAAVGCTHTVAYRALCRLVDEGVAKRVRQGEYIRA